MSLIEYFMQDRLDAIERRISALESENQTNQTNQINQVESCKHDGGFTQMPNSGRYQKCRQCGIAAYWG